MMKHFFARSFSRRGLSITVLATACGVLTACANPLVTGYTGSRTLPLSEQTPVLVIGADPANPLAIERYDQAIKAAHRGRSLMGTSTAISDAPLRDAQVASAARELGAAAVFYTYVYLNTTVERHATYHDRQDGRYEREISRRVSDTSRHWYEYRATFFGPLNSVRSDQESVPPSQPQRFPASGIDSQSIENQATDD